MEAITEALMAPTQSSISTGRKGATICQILSNSGVSNSMLTKMNALSEILPTLYDIDVKVICELEKQIDIESSS